MTVGSIIGGGIRLIRAQPQVVAVWVVLYGIAIALFTTAIRLLMAPIAAMQQQNAANAAAGVLAPPVFPAGTFGSLFLLELIFMVLIVIAFAAVVRAVTRPTGDRFAYLRIGMDELRLIGLGVLLAILFLFVELVGLLVVFVVGALSGYILGKSGGTAVGVGLGIVLLCALVYAQVRLSLSGALTVMTGRIVITDAWRAARGHFWTLFGAYLVIGLAIMILGIVFLAMTQSHLLAAYASFNPQAIQAAAQEQAKAQVGISLGYIVQLILGTVITIPLYIVFFGAVATAAVELGGVRSTIAAEFE